MNRFISIIGAIAGACVLGCESQQSTTADRNSPAAMREDSQAEQKAARTQLREDAKAALEKAKQTDPSLAAFLRESKGYAVFPTVGKGAVGIGGAYGKGVLYEGGSVSGYCELTQASLGAQLGGQAYTEIIVFSTQDAINHLKVGSTAFDAQATAVAAKSGAAANAKYRDGVAVFTTDQAGLMVEASIGGQKFSFQPK